MEYTTKKFQTGDLVLVLDKNADRTEWPLTSTIEIMPGKDGTVTTVKIRTKDSYYTRASQKFCLLEEAVSNLSKVMYKYI